MTMSCIVYIGIGSSISWQCDYIVSHGMLDLVRKFSTAKTYIYRDHRNYDK